MSKESEDPQAGPLARGDLILHIPTDGKRGSGPHYLDDPVRYGGDETRVAVKSLVSGPLAWLYDLPKHEVVAVGHVDVEPDGMLGVGFTVAALKRFAPEIKKGREEFYKRFSTFQDGRSEVHVSQLKWPMRGFMGQAVLPELVNLSQPDINAIKFGELQIQVNRDEKLIVHAVPQTETDAYIEPTAITGSNFTMMLAYIPEAEGTSARSGYFAAPGILARQ